MGLQGKSGVLPLLIISNLIFIAATAASCVDGYKQKAARNKEAALRMDLEAKASASIQEKSGVEKKIDNITQELSAGKSALEAADKELLQERLIGQSLREELQKLNKRNAELEDALSKFRAKEPDQR